MTEFVSESPTTFVLSGGREVVNEERAKELIAIANITDHDAITKVVLSNKSITEKAAEVFSIELKKFKNVTVVDISDIIAGRPEDEALNTLKWICEEGLSHCQQNIIEVNVSDNALGVKGINVIKSILVGKKLENVYFCNNGMSAEAAALICELLLQSTDDNNEEIEKSNEKQSPPPLKILHFFNNMSGNGGGVAIAKLITACSKTLTNIRFSATRCMASGCQNIVEALFALPSDQLTRLDISDNNFNTSNGQVLVNSLLKQMSSLKYLNLRDCSLGNDVIMGVLASESLTNCPIETLDISGNELTGDCIKPLSTGLSVLMGQYLSELFIDDNDELIGNPVDNEDEDVDEEDEDEEDEDVEVKDVKPYMKRMHTLCKGLFQSKRCLKIFSCISCRLSSYGICTLLRYYLKYHSEASILVRCNSNCCSEAGMNVIEEIKDENESIRFDELDDMEVVEEDEDDMKSYEISLTDPLEDMHNEEPVEENEEVEKLVEALDKVAV